MFSREEILKLAKENVLITKYLKPEAQAEAQVLEEKLGKAVENHTEIYKIGRKLIDIVAQNIEVRYQPLEELEELILKSIFNDEVPSIVETNIQKLKLLNEIISELNEISYKNYTEEYDKKPALTPLITNYKIIFSRAKSEIKISNNKYIITEIEEHENKIKELVSLNRYLTRLLITGLITLILYLIFH